MSDPIYSTVAYVSGDCFAVSNAAGDTFAGEFAAGVRVWADCRADGIRLGTVTAAIHDASAGRTLVTVAVDAGAALTPNLAAVLHGNDNPESLCSHAANHAVGGRDALPPASTVLAGLVRLASSAEIQAGTNTDKAVTPAGLALAAKGLISANTTLYVAAIGSDSTGTGAAGAPFASIGKALSSIAGKLIASGSIVTIQVADGTYTISSSIAIDHPDADKIQILGNTSARTTVAIASISTTAKTFTVAGNYVSNTDASKNIAIGDAVGLAGSITSGLNKDYIVSGLAYTGGNTVVTCASEVIPSSVVGGGSLVIMPCNKVVLHINDGITGIRIKSKIANIAGIRFDGAGYLSTATRAVYAQSPAEAALTNVVISNVYIGIHVNSGKLSAVDSVLKNCNWSVFVESSSAMAFYGICRISSSVTFDILVSGGSYVQAISSVVVLESESKISPVTADGSSGNFNSFLRR